MFPELGQNHLFGKDRRAGQRLTGLMQHVFADRYEQMLSQIIQCIEMGTIKKHRPHQILMILHGAAVTYYNIAPMVRSAFDRDPLKEENWREYAEAYMDIMFDGLATR